MDREMTDQPTLTILLVEDQDEYAELVQRVFASADNSARLTVAASLTEAREFLAETSPDLIIADLILPDGRGTDLLMEETSEGLYPMIVMTGYGDEQMAVDALRAGALDYLVKSPHTVQSMPRIAQRALREWRFNKEKAQAEQEIQARKTYLERVLSAVPDAIITLDARNHIVEWNPGAERIFGYARKKVIGKSLDPLISNPDTIQETSKFIQSVLGRNTVGPIETICYRKDGSPVHVRLTGSPLLEDDELLGAVAVFTDITAQKQAEQALRQSEQRYRGIFEGVQDAIFVERLNGEILDVNAHACEMFGYSREELLTKTVNDLVAPGTHLLIQDVQEGRSIPDAPVESVNIRANGQPFLAEVTGRLHNVGDQDVMLIVVRDITERVQARESLEASEERYRGLVENAPTGILSVDTQGNILDVNPRLLEILGSPSAQATLAINVFTFPPLVASGVAANFRRCVEAGETLVAEHPYTSKWGKKMYLRYHMTPIRQIAGDVVGMLANVEDISEQVQREAERARLLTRIQQQAQQVQQLVDTVPAGVLLLDSRKHVLLANPAARQALSTLAGEVTHRPLTHLGPLSIDEILAHHADPLPIEITLTTQPPCIFEVQVRPIGDDETRQWVFTLRDVTREREQQRQIQAQERLATVGQLAAGIAHDFNNIMASIVLYAKMMLNTPDLSERNKKRLATIHQQGHRAANLVQQILDFARKAVMERQPLDLIPFVKELEKLLERTLPENIHIFVEHGHEDYIVNADPTRIQQVVMNLALNARDAMPGGGDLRFRFSLYRLEPGEASPFVDMPPGEWVRLDVSDTGTGIAPDVLPHIFEPFFTTKEVGKGTGLGLAQVYGIVAQHEGFINVQSHLGVGTTFFIYLPALVVPEVLESLSEKRELVRGGGETILVVEDDVIAREVIAEVLDELGYRVLTAANGKEALDVFDQRVDLVLSDWVMPKMGGSDLYTALRARRPDVKMVVVTGYPMADEVKSPLESGITAWLKKPFTDEEIAQAVRTALE